MTRTRYPQRANSGPPWTDAEDLALVRLRRSKRSWEQCAEAMPGRTPAGCKTRYQKVTAPGADENRPPKEYDGANAKRELAMLARLVRDGGFPVLREVQLSPDRYGVAIGRTPIVANFVTLGRAA